MELLQTESSACEQQGTISLDIIRRGNLAVSSYIAVKVCTSFVTETEELLSFFKTLTKVN